MAGERRVGDWIGERFEIFDVHEGGMSLVYVAHDHLGESGRTVVALKTLKDELLGHRVRRSRFANECRLWVQLGRHRNIVQAYSVEIFEGRPYVVLELVQGGDLIRWIGSPKLDLALALKFGVQFCRGMEHATSHGLGCHRDIKPGNLLITQDGVLKITDFGLARISEEMMARPGLADGSIPLADEPGAPQRILFTDPRDQAPRPLGLLASDPPRVGRPSPDVALSSSASVQARPAGGGGSLPTTVDRETTDYVPQAEYAPPAQAANPRLTRAGARLGTGVYMAPEQFRDPASVDVRADIYAFGVVLFEMIAGALPFKGKSLDMLERQHTRYAPPSVVPFVPRRFTRLAPSVDEVVQRCLKKDPEDRYRTVTDLRKALAGLLARLGAK